MVKLTSRHPMINIQLASHGSKEGTLDTLSLAPLWVRYLFEMGQPQHRNLVHMWMLLAFLLTIPSSSRSRSQSPSCTHVEARAARCAPGFKGKLWSGSLDNLLTGPLLSCCGHHYRQDPDEENLLCSYLLCTLVIACKHASRCFSNIINKVRTAVWPLDGHLSNICSRALRARR